MSLIFLGQNSLDLHELQKIRVRLRDCVRDCDGGGVGVGGRYYRIIIVKRAESVAVRPLPRLFLMHRKVIDKVARFRKVHATLPYVVSDIQSFTKRLVRGCENARGKLRQKR